MNRFFNHKNSLSYLMFGLIVFACFCNLSGFAQPQNESFEYTIQTDEQISQALKKVKSLDVETYKKLKHLKRKNFDKFIKLLNQFVKENDPRANAKEKHRLIRKERDLRMKLDQLSKKFQLEEDPQKKKSYEKKLSKLIDQLFETEMAQTRLVIRVKKQEVALINTRYQNRLKTKPRQLQEYANRYINKSTP